MKDRIIRESIESLRREGLRFSVDTLAEKLGVSKKTIYKYFPNKETLAAALYQKYYADVKAQAERLNAETTLAAHLQLLRLYFDAKSMTSGDIFNKYKLNEALYAYTAEENDNLWGIIVSALDGGVSERDTKALRIIVDGSFEKLCREKISPDGVIDRLANLLW